MNSSFSYTDELHDSDDEESSNEFNIQDSIIFLVDGTEQMYKNDSFKQCLETYRNIVRQKCSCNRKDKMGFIIFGTKDGIMVLQEFNTVTVDSLKNIQNILKEGSNKYRQLASDSKYPLFDALTHAFQISNSYKSTKARNIIVLCTCNDNPCSGNPSERRRIEHLLATFKDTQIELRVVGLSDSWNDEIFYKELQIIAGTSSNDNYKQIYLKDFEQTIISPARSICKVPLKISSDISIEVSVINLVSNPKYPPKIKLLKQDNEILEARSILQAEKVEDNEIKNSESQCVTEVRTEKKIITLNNLLYYKTYSGLRVSFKPTEHKQIKNLGLEPSIEILAFKPIMCDPLYHCKSPYFVTYTTSCNDESKAFFISLISRCAEKKVMPISRVVTKTAILISMMIPSEDDGGFYMYKMPFKDSVRDLDNLLPGYIFNSENKSPVDKEAVYICKKLIELTKIEFDPKLFSNPKLEKCIAHIEALALDEKLNSLPSDSTLPPPISKDVANLKPALIGLGFNDVESKKRTLTQGRGEKRQRLDIGDLALNKKLDTLTVADLKEFLKEIGESTQGNKSKLIDRIYKYYSK